jgi:DNA replication protein DnaC
MTNLPDKQRKWETRILPQIIPAFSPRLQVDLKTYSPPAGVEWNPGSSYYIYGPVGSGKTLLAAYMILEAKRVAYMQGKDFPEAILLSIPELLLDIRRTFGKDPESELELINRVCDADLLVLDDLGSEKDTDWSFQMIYLIINRRYEAMKSTIVTSNLSLDGLSDALGDDRISSRLKQMCEIIFLNFKDFRLL